VIASLGRHALLRIAPFALFMLLLALRGFAADGAWGFDERWIYAASTLGVATLLGLFRHDYGELARALWPDAREAALALAAGVAVFVVWINLDQPWMRVGEATAGFRPVDAQGQLIWPLVAARWAGAALVVPLMEELFWRSFLMRWMDSARFELVPPQRVSLRAIALSTFVFMLAHTLWLAAIVAGLVYAWLYVRSGKLWLAVLAHAVTNALLGGWVLLTGNWGYW
jgi:CAAX prenyl protease-like protein